MRNHPTARFSDLLPSRLAAAKEAAAYFIDKIPLGARMGIISFSGTANVESELTQDKQALKNVLQHIDFTEAGGTNILDAVVASGNLVKDEDAKAVILLSDGQLNVHSVQEIIDYAKKNSVAIYTLGIGTREGGDAQYFISKLDEDSLKALAFNTGGNYYQVSSKEDFQKAFEAIAVTSNKVVGIELKNYCIIFALVLVSLQWVLLSTKWRGIP